MSVTFQNFIHLQWYLYVLVIHYEGLFFPAAKALLGGVQAGSLASSACFLFAPSLPLARLASYKRHPSPRKPPILHTHYTPN